MRQRILIGLALFFVVIGILYLVFAQPDEARLSADAVTGRKPDITAPRQQIWPTVKVADAVGWKQGEAPTPAPGLKVNAFATGLEHPRWLYRLANGDMLVAESNSPPRTGGGIQGWVMGYLLREAGAGVASPNKIVLLRDANGDGVAESRSVLLDASNGLNSPFGMVVVGPWLYVANTDALIRYPFTPGQTRITAKPEKIVDLPGGGNHWARNVIAAGDGGSLFVSVGSSTNIADNGLDAEKLRANILQVFPDKKTFRIYAAGMRNPNGMAIEPHSRALWAAVNERDMLGSDLPPDYMTAVEAGDNFGWPWFYWGGWPDHRVQPENQALQEYSKRPDYALGAHTASLGLTFAADAKLGPAFANGAFIGQHGSWNRRPPAGYKVVYVPFADNGFPVKGAKPVDVLTGFLDAKGRARGRPVGVTFDTGGALLVADDVGNVIWRVSAAAPAPAPATK